MEERELQEEIGRRIKRLRLNSGMTLEVLAEKVDLSASYLSRIERGKNSPSLNVLVKLAKVMNVSVRSFFDPEDIKGGVLIRRRDDRSILTDEYHRTKFDEILPPGVVSNFAVSRIIFEVGGKYEKKEELHRGYKTGVVIKGKLELTVGDNVYTLMEGDSFCLDTAVPYFLKNTGEIPLDIVFFFFPKP